jgi:aryl sulfotransferase
MMDHMADAARVRPGDAARENSRQALLRQQESFLREIHDVAGKRLSARLAAAGFHDVSWDALVLMGAMRLGGPAALGMVEKLGITGQAVDNLRQELIMRGYLELRDGLEGHNRPSMSMTERGRAMLDEAESGIRAARWADFPFRPGDIVICTTPKSGTTWMQMICALLIFQTPELPAPLPDISPRLDFGFMRDEMFARLAAQEHRRFIKTHVPLNDIPADPRVTYIVVGRHPLDTAVSQYHRLGAPQRAERHARALRGPVRRPARRDAPPRGTPRHHRARGEVAEPGRTATFKQMRAAADRIQPLRDRRDGTSLDHAAFFRRGTSGDGRALLTDGELARYHARAAQLAPPDLLAWLHHQDEPSRGSPPPIGDH